MPGSEALAIPHGGKRLSVLFARGFLFYATWQCALLVELLRTRCDAIWANDLDTLLPAFLASKWHGIPLIYDSHEFFTEAAGLTGRPFQRGVWLRLEHWVYPRLKSVITVNDSIANAYEKRYPTALSVRPRVVRNMPLKREFQTEKVKWREELGIPKDAVFAVLQGAYLDKDRGVKEAVEALRANRAWHLVVVGAGAEFEWAMRQVSSCDGRLICLPKMPFEKLCTLTAAADFGFSLDRGVHGNYWFSLPNKLFDYIHARIPVVASPMPEVKKVVEDWQIGVVIDDHSPTAIGMAVDAVLQTPSVEWERRCSEASESLNWQAEAAIIAEAMKAAEAVL
ncbi:MAG: glycosyltransferase [Flavobacteriales bacterium]|nr:glycosyltransferase [Flavobacteriales bacterium]